MARKPTPPNLLDLMGDPGPKSPSEMRKSGMSTSEMRKSGMGRSLMADADSSAYFMRIPGPVDKALRLCRNRMMYALAMYVLLMAAVALRLVSVAISGPVDTARSSRSSLEAQPANARPMLSFSRADVVDRNGHLLATNLVTSSVYADARMMKNPAKTAKDLRRIFPDLNETAIRERLSSGRPFVWIKRNITPRQKFEVNRLGEPGLNFQNEERRMYPQGGMLAHVLGYVDVDNQGVAGIEKNFNALLSSRPDAPLELSIDLRVQHALYEALSQGMRTYKAKGAAGVVLEARSGEVLGMVSLPDFDPHRAGNAPPEKRFNRATLGVYEMGSTFKSFTVAMALDSGQVSVNDSFDATNPIRFAGFTINDNHPEKRWLTVPEIFAYSSNIGSVRMIEKVGAERQQRYLSKLGFFEPVAVELPERGHPLMPNHWRELNMMTASYGHGIAVTPLHMVRAMAALVNGGALPPVTLIKGGNDGDEGEKILHPATSKTMRELLRRAVVQGTGRKSDVPGFLVGGKTGSAEKAEGGGYAGKSLISSFIGAFPMDNPRYVTLVLLDEPQGVRESHGQVTAGWNAAPATAHLVQRIAPILGVRPNDKDMIKDVSFTHDIKNAN